MVKRAQEPRISEYHRRMILGKDNEPQNEEVVSTKKAQTQFIASDKKAQIQFSGKKAQVISSGKKAQIPLKNNPFDTVFSHSSKKAQIPMVVVRNEPTEDDIKAWLSTASGWCLGLTSIYGDPVVLDGYAIDIIDETSIFTLQNKSRRIGVSFAYSMRGISSSHLLDEYQAIFVSYNQDDANNKISYAKAAYESLPESWKKKLVVDNVQRLEFEAYNGRYKSRTTLISHPQREPRGKGTKRTDVFLDEFAHYTWADKIYVAAIPMLSFGGSLFMGSTPLGNRGKFYEIANDPMKHRVKIANIPFYCCPRLVTDVAGAINAANQGATLKEIISRFGTEILLEIYVNMDEDFFRQEYCCSFLDDATFFFPPDILNKCKYPYRQEDMTGESVKELKYPLMVKYPSKNFIYCADNYEMLLSLLQQGYFLDGDLYAGYDVGRRKDTAEFLIVYEDRNNIQTMIFNQSFNKMSFEKQLEFLYQYMDTLPITKFAVDETGSGMQLAEQLHSKYKNRVKKFSFTNQLKNYLFTNVKIRLESQTMAIPDNMDLIRQLISIRRNITSFSNVTYEVDQGEIRHHHADKVIALCLASISGTPAQKDFNESKSVYAQTHDVKRDMLTPGMNETMGIGLHPFERRHVNNNRIMITNEMPKLQDVYGETFGKVFGVPNQYFKSKRMF